VRFIALLFAIMIFSGEAYAHQTSLSYVSVVDRGGAVTTDVKMSFLDLEVAAGVDQDYDGKITWGEAKASLDRLSAYAKSRTTLTAGGPCRLERSFAEPETLNGEGYLVLRFDVRCPDAAAPVQVGSTIFLEIDPTSRVLVSSRTGGKAETYVLGLAEQRAAAPLQQGERSGGQQTSFLSYFEEGVSHLFGGQDHVLFLLVLIIPALYVGGGLKSTAIALLLPITGFTLGHALTLTSAASGLIRPPMQIVEALIAVTILMTAIDNVKAFIPGPRSLVAFVFGLIHGFGFAGALGALDVSGWQMATALLGFNLGIEAGQAALALAAAPLLYLVRQPARRFHLMPLGVSMLAGAMAIYWIIERTLLV
jgi:hypothetical protein